MAITALRLDSPTRRRRWLPAFALLLALAVPATIIGVRLADRSTTHSTSLPIVPMPRSAAIEERFGIRFERVSVVAADGMLELRYRVLDASKALGIHDPTHPDYQPSVIDQVSGTHLAAPPIHGHAMAAAGLTATQFILNVKDVVKPGGRVTLVVGGIQLKDVSVVG
jgi:hypothetical protein